MSEELTLHERVLEKQISNTHFKNRTELMYMWGPP